MEEGAGWEKRLREILDGENKGRRRKRDLRSVGERKGGGRREGT